MNRNTTLVQKICNTIIKEPVMDGFSIVDSFNSIPESYGAKVGLVMEEYINYWLSNNEDLQRIVTQESYKNRISIQHRNNVAILDDGDFHFLNQDGSSRMSFDGLYICSGMNIPIEVKSGNLNGYVKHLDTVQASFYSIFGKGAFIHPVFIPFRKDTFEYVVPKLEKAVAKFPELVFIDISDIVYDVQLVQQELSGSDKKLKEPYKTQISKRTYIYKEDETNSQGRGNTKIKERKKLKSKRK